MRLMSALWVMIAVPMPSNAAPLFSVLYSFAPGNGQSYGGLAVDGKGNLYGTICGDSAQPDGAVFKLTHPSTADAAWTESVIYSFQGIKASDGNCPMSGLTFDAKGALYGTTYYGGTGPGFGYGTVFQLVYQGDSKEWTETVLWRFEGVPDGNYPTANVTLDGAGNVYGTTTAGGTHTLGTVFEVSPPAAGNGPWTEGIIHSFGGDGDGTSPYYGLTLDGNGAIYGTTPTGGIDYGVVFQLSPPASPGGTWAESILHSFTCSGDGCMPDTTLVFDSAGALYGTTSESDDGKTQGAVFKMSPPSMEGGAWAESVIHRFDGTDGEAPYAGLLIDAQGNLFGTTSVGGESGCVNATPPTCGVVFGLKPPLSAGSAWLPTTIYKFTGGVDGGNPNNGGLTFGSGTKGQLHLYGVTIGPVAANDGVVFEIDL